MYLQAILEIIESIGSNAKYLSSHKLSQFLIESIKKNGYYWKCSQHSRQWSKNETIRTILGNQSSTRISYQKKVENNNQNLQIVDQCWIMHHIIEHLVFCLRLLIMMRFLIVKNFDQSNDDVEDGQAKSDCPHNWIQYPHFRGCIQISITRNKEVNSRLCQWCIPIGIGRDTSKETVPK